MALLFPISASIGQTYQTGSSNTYEWTGTYWKIKNVINFNAFSASVVSRINAANTNWNNTYDSYLIRKTEQLTFSGDYILENAFLLIEGGDEEVEYSANKSFKKEGTIFIGGNLLLKDSAIENNGLISVGGEVILIGNSSIDGTGTII
jgi:hypothetical protein